MFFLAGRLLVPAPNGRSFVLMALELSLLGERRGVLRAVMIELKMERIAEAATVPTTAKSSN
ncbi:MAG: hypothetical protein AWU57_3847 [Marinobacter sp. T13-3]|nr:MAG: hypothetical protein AWU57_3847 [Marinobacter sp. T13-3]